MMSTENRTMITFRRSTSVVLVVAAIASAGACSSVPDTSATLERARADFSRVQQHPRAAALAALELEQAGKAIERADAAWRDGAQASEVDHLAYLVSQRAAIAGATISQKIAEQSVADANAVRDRTRLDARTREADLANRTADSAQRQAGESLRQSEDSQRQAEQARRESAVSAQQARDAQSRNAQLESQLKELNAKQTERGMVVTIGDLLFDTNRARLNPGAMRSIDQLAGFFRENPKRKALLEGFTDSIGSESSNQDLSDRRASAVRSALVERGVDGGRLSVHGYGESYPIAGNDSAGSRQMNRRVEIVLSDDSGLIAPR